MTNEAALFEVVTLVEAGAMWGKSPRAIHLKLERYENKNPDKIVIRKSGSIILTTLSALREVYGNPVHPRPNYGV